VPFLTVPAKTNNNSWATGVHVKLLIKVSVAELVFEAVEVSDSFDSVAVATAWKTGTEALPVELSWNLGSDITISLPLLKSIKGFTTISRLTGLPAIGGCTDIEVPLKNPTGAT
jgi:hypothetical protein